MFKFTRYITITKEEYEKLKKDKEEWASLAGERYVHGICLAAIMKVHAGDIYPKYDSDGQKRIQEHVDYFDLNNLKLD